MWFLRVAEKRRFRSGVGQRVENREKMKISCTRSLSDDSTDSTDFWQFLTILDQKQPHTQIALPKIQLIDQKIKFDKWNQIFYEIFACSWIEFHAKGHKILKFNIKIVTQIVAHLVAQEWLI